MQDPLQALPAEIILRCIEFTPLSGIAALNQVSKAWHDFLDITHQDAIYAQQAQWLYSSNPRSDREEQPLGRDFAAFGQGGRDRSFVRYFEGADSWKDFCKRLSLLESNWASERPVVRESVIQIGIDPVWRFKPDFKRRFVVSTSQSGGVRVTDMDSGRLLWRLNRDDVRMCAHLEYDQETGTACWDRFGNAIEVWKADEVERGAFHRVAVLNHDCETRGFQLSRFKGKETLCVVSSEGKGFVWDLSQHPPQQRIQIDIEDEAVGHLDQGEELVMYSMGERGYHVHSKDTGELVGKISPKECSNIYHIRHPAPQPDVTIRSTSHGPTPRVWPPQHPRKDRLTPLRLQEGAHPAPQSPLTLGDDEWGSGMISGNYMAGVSRGGRIFICSDLRGALADPARFKQTTAILHTEGDGSAFELGGWLSIKNRRIIFEIVDRVYVFSLPDEGQLPGTGDHQRPIWATPISSAPQLMVPVSFMGIYDDCIMYTYTTLGFRNSRSRRASNDEEPAARRARAFPTKTIRVLSLAPNLSATPGKELDYIPGLEVYNRDIVSDSSPVNRAQGMQAGLLQLMALLTGDNDESESEAEDSDLDEDARERLEAELEEDERREWEEYEAFERDEEQREREEMADMMGWNDSDESVEDTRQEGAPNDDDDGWEDVQEGTDGDGRDGNEVQQEGEHPPPTEAGVMLVRERRRRGL